MRKSRPAEYNAAGKAKYLAKLQKEDEAYEKHMTAILKREGKTWMARSWLLRSGLGRAGPASSSRSTRTRPSRTRRRAPRCRRSRVGASRRGGPWAFFWPLDAFKKQCSRDPRPSEVTRLTQAGQALSGVVRPVGEGTADGCVELVDTGYCEMQHVGVLRESAQVARGATETLEVANFAFEKMKVSVTEMAAPDNPEDVSLKLKGDSKKKSSDIDDLDSLWDGVLIVSGAGSGGVVSRGSPCCEAGCGG